MSAKFRVPLDGWIADIYRRVKLALLTGWSLEYIDGLGLLDSEAILQINEAENYVEVRHGS